MNSEMRPQGNNQRKLQKKESLIVLGVALIFSLLILLLFMIAPGPLSQMYHTAVTEFYSNSAPPSIPKWASSRASRAVTGVQPTTASAATVLAGSSAEAEMANPAIFVAK